MWQSLQSFQSLQYTGAHCASKLLPFYKPNHPVKDCEHCRSRLKAEVAKTFRDIPVHTNPEAYIDVHRCSMTLSSNPDIELKARTMFRKQFHCTVNTTEQTEKEIDSVVSALKTCDRLLVLCDKKLDYIVSTLTNADVHAFVWILTSETLALPISSKRVNLYIAQVPSIEDTLSALEKHKYRISVQQLLDEVPGTTFHTNRKAVDYKMLFVGF